MHLIIILNASVDAVENVLKLKCSCYTLDFFCFLRDVMCDVALVVLCGFTRSDRA